MLSGPSRLVKGHSVTSNCFTLPKPVRGPKEVTPHSYKDNFSKLWQQLMSAKLTRSVALEMDKSTTQGLMPSRLISFTAPSILSSFKLLSPAKP
jgi:hypothetical protein